MKKLTALLLAIIMIFSLTACSSKSEAVKNTEALIKAIGEVTVESDDAITAAEEAYAALPEEEKAQVSGYEKLTQARENFTKEIVLGEWCSVSFINEDETTVLVFKEDGTFTLDTGVGGTYKVNGSTVELGVVDMGLSLVLNLENRNGITHICADNNTDYVKKEDATYSEIEITNENWKDYFDVKESVHAEKNGFDEVQQIFYSHQLEIKDEYRNRVVNMYSDKKVVAVEVTYKEDIIEVSLGENGELITKPSSFSYHEKLTKVVDINGRGLTYNDYEDGHAYARSIVYGSSFTVDGTMLMWYPYDVTINRVGGVLLLYDNPIH